MNELMTGAEAIARAAIDSGCDFFAGYPITPATPVLLHMTDHLPRVGGVAIQAEDEISAIGMCIGAAMAGSRVLTATSGPGISLYSENVGLAVMGEVPMVIVDAQRMGPATGGATTVAQSDVQFLRWGTSGGFPVIVLAPADAAECYTLTRRAFDLAERFRVPVFLATDKETVLGVSTVDADAFEAVPVRPRVAPAEDEPFAPYRADGPDGVPALGTYGGPHIVRFTTSTHDEEGYLTKVPAKVAALNTRLAAKVEDHLDEIALLRVEADEGAEVAVVSYGIVALSAAEAASTFRAAGGRLVEVAVQSLWPVPEQALGDALAGVRRVVVPELNLGQYRRELERILPDGVEVVGVNRVDGELIAPTDIVEALS